MYYLERTIIVRDLILQRPDIVDKIKRAFTCHYSAVIECRTNVPKPFGYKGSHRIAYDHVSKIVVPYHNGRKKRLSLLLKLGKYRGSFSFEAAKAKKETDASLDGLTAEFGAFETYHDFVSGNIQNVSFVSQEAYEKFCSKYPKFAGTIAQSFKLDDEKWLGTRVTPGDLGVVPYFQLFVRFGDWFGVLTESNNALTVFKPTKAVICPYNDYEEETTHARRIIDLGPSHCLLIKIDSGDFSLGGYNSKYDHSLGTKKRGEKYFDDKNALIIQ